VRAFHGGRGGRADPRVSSGFSGAPVSIAAKVVIALVAVVRVRILALVAGRCGAATANRGIPFVQVSSAAIGLALVGLS
jgi:hypothetical protein